MTAVIHENSFDKIVSYIESARDSEDAKIIIGGDYDKYEGFFISPTVCLLYTSPSPRDRTRSRMPSSA